MVLLLVNAPDVTFDASILSTHDEGHASVKPKLRFIHLPSMAVPRPDTLLSVTTTAILVISALERYTPGLPAVLSRIIHSRFCTIIHAVTLYPSCPSNIPFSYLVIQFPHKVI